MNKVLWMLVITLGVIITLGNITMLGLFALTSVGLSAPERIMLTMTSNDINMAHASSIIVLNQLSSLQNVTAELLFLTQQLVLLKQSHTASDNAVETLNITSVTREAEIIAYNTTIGQQMNIIQVKIDNVTIPTSLNLTLADNTTVISNGTVLLSNPNNRNENTTLNYEIKSQLGNVFIEVSPIASAISYTTLGLNNYVGLKDWNPPIFALNNTSPGFTFDQVLDDQRNKISVSPPIGKRIYDPVNNEIQLEFESLLVGGQTITLNEVLGFNVGFI